MSEIHLPIIISTIIPSQLWDGRLNGGSRYARKIAEEFPTDISTNDDTPDAVKVYRKVLSEQDDERCDILKSYKASLRVWHNGTRIIHNGIRGDFH